MPHTPAGTELTLKLHQGADAPTLHWAWAGDGFTHTLCGIHGIHLEANPDYAEVADQCPLCAMFAALLADRDHGRDIPPNQWAGDAIQFPRLLAEIAEIGLDPEQDTALGEAMTGMDENEVAALFDRARYRWDAIKAGVRDWPDAEPAQHDHPVSIVAFDDDFDDGPGFTLYAVPAGPGTSELTQGQAEALALSPATPLVIPDDFFTGS